MLRHAPSSCSVLCTRRISPEQTRWDSRNKEVSLDVHLTSFTGHKGMKLIQTTNTLLVKILYSNRLMAHHLRSPMISKIAVLSPFPMPTACPDTLLLKGEASLTAFMPLGSITMPSWIHSLKAEHGMGNKSYTWGLSGLGDPVTLRPEPLKDSHFA